jgi:hypothetical protein
VDEYKVKLEKLSVRQGGKLVLEKGDDPKDLWKALKAAAGALQPTRTVSVPRGRRDRLVDSEGHGLLGCLEKSVARWGADLARLPPKRFSWCRSH